MKILVDMNLSPNWVDFLTKNGIEAAHWSFIGPPDAHDTEIFSYAKTHNFTVLTNDLDFGFILAITHGEKPSVIQTRTGALGTDRIGDIVVNAIRQLAADIEQGALITVDQHKVRVTLLPL
jgi:predicted nuclease of predicted toxin-antitoxin system